MTRELTPKIVRKIAKLAHIRMDDAEVAGMAIDLNTIFDWIEQLNEVDITGVDPLTAADMTLKMRDDVVNDGGNRRAIMFNTPEGGARARAASFFTVPKVIGDNE